MKSKKGAAEWFWIFIGMTLAIIVAITLLFMFFDFGDSIRGTFDDVVDLTDRSADELTPNEPVIDSNAVAEPPVDSTKHLLQSDVS